MTNIVKGVVMGYRNNRSLIFRSYFFRDLFVSVFLAVLVFSPLLFNERPELLFSGDLHNLYFPQFVNGYYQSKASLWYGVDLLTNNGSSAYYLRPNIPVYYPPNILIYKLLNLYGISEFAIAFVWSLCIHAAVSLYAVFRFSEKYLKLDFRLAMLCGTSYVFTIVQIVSLTPFFYIAALFPVLVYVAVYVSYLKSWQACLIGSFVFLCAFLSGYLPLAVHAVILSVVLAIALRWTSEDRDEQISAGSILFALLPGLCAAAFVFPWYLAVLQYHKLVSGVLPGVWAAHEMSYTLQDLASVATWGFLPSTQAEAPHIVVGLLPLFIIGIAFSSRARLDFSDRDGRLAIFALVVFGFHLLLAAGRMTGLPDVFYYLVPGLGKMHIYGRYLVVSSFYVFLASALLLKKLINSKNEVFGNYIIPIDFFLLASACIYGQIYPSAHVRVQVIVMELLFIALFILIFRSGGKNWLVFGVIIAVTLIKLGGFNDSYNHIDLAQPPSYANAIIFSAERQQSFLNYARHHASEKEVIKYADLTSTIDKPSGVLLNFPWMIGAGTPVSNYMGYELHLSVDRDYLKRFPYFGKVDFNWLIETGVDYLIVDPAARKMFAEKIAEYADRSVPELDLGFGYALIKVITIAPLEGKTVDNGVFSVFSADPLMEVSGLDGNLTSYIAFNVRSSSPISIRYLMFPSKLMQFSVNGQAVDFHGIASLARLELPQGKHRIEYQYKNTLHVFFVQVLPFYLIILFSVSIWLIIGAAYRATKGVQISGDVGA
jgi:hypothetical protein